MKYIFAGDRQISVNILKFMIEEGYPPGGLILNDIQVASHNESLLKLVAKFDLPILYGDEFKSEKALQYFETFRPHYFIGIHFPKIIPVKILQIPEIGFLNLHPAYLPFNKGWHTPSWAILDDTAYGATLHFMSETLDGGNIIHQKSIDIDPGDTAHTLYQRVLTLEEEVFKESFPWIKSLSPPRIPQSESGTAHKQKDLAKMQKINLDEVSKNSDLIKRLRALTTNKWGEAAYYEVGAKRYYIQVTINAEDI